MCKTLLTDMPLFSILILALVHFKPYRGGDYNDGMQGRAERRQARGRVA